VNKFQIAIRPFDGGEPIRVFDAPDLEFGQWSRDGKALYCFYKGGTELYLQPVDGREPKRLTNFNQRYGILSFSISPDGKQIALVRGNENQDAISITNFIER